MSNENIIRNAEDNTLFGFWIYLMSDCIIFAVLFATYVVMMHNTADGPSGKEIFNIPFVLIETIILLISSITYGMVVISMYKQNKNAVIGYLVLTFLLGVLFVSMENYEFHNLIVKDFGPHRSGFLSAFFTLISTHALHVTAGLVWMIVLMLHIIKTGLTHRNYIRILCLSLFWHFLDIIWICVFTVVYLIGVL